jgi:hypothetical protein
VVGDADEAGGRPVEFQQVVGKRRMVRAFRAEPLAPAVVERILANGNRACGVRKPVHAARRYW